LRGRPEGLIGKKGIADGNERAGEEEGKRSWGEFWEKRWIAKKRGLGGRGDSKNLRKGL